VTIVRWQLLFVCENSGTVAIVPLGLILGWQEDEIVLNLKLYTG